MQLADLGNEYINTREPWNLIKDKKYHQDVHKICTLGLNLFRILIIYLKPILPELAKQVEGFLDIAPLLWQDSNQPLLNHSIKQFQPLMTRIRKEQIDQIMAKTAQHE